MEFDTAWLNPKMIRKAINVTKVFINQPIFNDEVGLRLRKEIVNWLGLSIVSGNDEADLEILIEQLGTNSNEEFHLDEKKGVIVIKAPQPVGALYGLYVLCRLKLQGKSIRNYSSKPDQSLRMVNHWDQVDGTVERGYAGASLFFGKFGKNYNQDSGSFDLRKIEGDIFRRDYNRIVWYGRMLASVGINAISLNNVNVRGLSTRLIEEPYLSGVADIAKIFTGFGIKTFLAINWDAPRKIGGLSTSDPFEKDVKVFWRKKCINIYKKIPDFGGFIVKADSEGEPGPYVYGRNHAQGANMLAEAIKPFGGVIIWRAFVYNSKQDWRDRSTDRAKSAYENFMPLDGQFDDNVILQVKFGPMDFQTEEPLTPLFGGLKNTNQIMEFEITAEYLGHQIDINYTMPQWCKMANFDTKGKSEISDQAREVIKQSSVDSKNSGFAGVGNVGMDYNWTGNYLAQANLYAFGRLCWEKNPNPKNILQEWIDQKFCDSNEQTRQTIFRIMISSNETYKLYTAPLGVGFMVVPHYHYGVSVNGYEYDRWGSYHFADRNGVGVDRTTATGTGFTRFYSPKVAEKYEDINKIDDDIILFFHHVKYSHILHNGKTVIQTIYDQHFQGYEQVKAYRAEWKNLHGKVDEKIFKNVDTRLDCQVNNAKEWCDQINTYFYRMSGIKYEGKEKVYD